MSWVERGIKGKFVCRRASLIRFRSFGVSIVKQLESDFKLLDDGKTLLQASSASLMIILWTITKLFTASSQFTAVKAVSRTTSWVNLHTRDEIDDHENCWFFSPLWLWSELDLLLDFYISHLLVWQKFPSFYFNVFFEVIFYISVKIFVVFFIKF